MLTEAKLRKISKAKSPKTNLLQALVAIAGEYKPHQIAHVLPQVMHESGGLRYDREVWGPTAAQQRYEGRKDLGNTQKGDGSKYRGYGPIQVTGRANVTEFYNWCKKRKLSPPNFIDKPELIATSPWAGWSVVWYWETRGLNRYADLNDIEMVTRKVNGGLNGYEDRLSYYDRSALVLNGYEPTDIRGFQRAYNLNPDGVSGPQTRAALHNALVAMVPGESSKPTVQSSPVVETVKETVEVPVTVEKPVVTEKVEKEVRQKTNWLSTAFAGIFGAGGISSYLAGMDKDSLILVLGIGIVVIGAVLFGGEWIVRRVRSIRKELASD